MPEIAPTFSADDIDEFVKFLVDRVGGGDGLEVLRRMEENRYRPSKKLMDHVASVINNNPEYTLPDEQQVAFRAVMTAARRGVHDRQKRIIIKGGLGARKSVLPVMAWMDPEATAGDGSPMA
ncbi:hypothetical protein J2794_005648 [Paraburkholderia terricola]|uniref:hypothetical protein n=1 Tax=Paraburkholderia terricola TaxID=169427 RepID=UPI002861688C|nr:hypothetical protein [Paraburkholderia terricola]MDR6449512.1 hypothetical protein [Paraburkholderia terricola]